MKTTIAILLSMIFGAPALAATFVYVSNADDGEIRTYTLQADGSLKPGQTAKAEKIVMPMVVTPDKRFVGTGPLAESFPYISLDRGGRFLFGASYGANLVSVNPVGADGRIGEPLQVVPTARNAHSIRVDNSNHFVFVPHLGTDQVFHSTKRADALPRTHHRSCSCSRAADPAIWSSRKTIAFSIC
jgi:6-phosphogluconolactonase